MRPVFTSIISLAIITALAVWLLLTPDETMQRMAAGDSHQHGHHEESFPRGPRGGRLLQQDGISVELALYETGVPPEYHAWVSQDGEPVEPESVTMRVELSRLGGRIDRIGFEAIDGFLRGDTVVAEPHSFHVDVYASIDDETRHWQYDSFEGRTIIPSQIARDAGITTQPATAAHIDETLQLTGRVLIDPSRLSMVHARFPGIIQEVLHELGDRVEEGDKLATVQSNESLQVYSVKAPISGILIKRQAQVGAMSSNDPLFVIADLERVWAELDVFGNDVSRIRPGQAVMIKTIGGAHYHGELDYLSPLALHDSQSVPARVVLDNSDQGLRPGQFIRAEVTLARHDVELAVPRSAIQSWRDIDVVYVRYGDTYEVRMIDIGISSPEQVQVTAGLEPGAEVVTGNSYLIKADIDKSGASHDH